MGYSGTDSGGQICGIFALDAQPHEEGAGLGLSHLAIHEFGEHEVRLHVSQWLSLCNDFKYFRYGHIIILVYSESSGVISGRPV